MSDWWRAKVDANSIGLSDQLTVLEGILPDRKDARCVRYLSIGRDLGAHVVWLQTQVKAQEHSRQKKGCNGFVKCFKQQAASASLSLVLLSGCCSMRTYNIWPQESDNRMFKYQLVSFCLLIKLAGVIRTSALNPSAKDSNTSDVAAKAYLPM